MSNLAVLVVKVSEFKNETCANLKSSFVNDNPKDYLESLDEYLNEIDTIGKLIDQCRLTCKTSYEQDVIQKACLMFTEDCLSMKDFISGKK